MPARTTRGVAGVARAHSVTTGTMADGFRRLEVITGVGRGWADPDRCEPTVGLGSSC